MCDEKTDKINLCFLFLWVWLVSMIDHYFTIKLADTIEQEEKNPIGQFLIQLDAGSPALFMTAKMVGLWVIFFSAIMLYYWRKQYAYYALGTMAIIQLFLVMHYFQTPIHK